MDEETPWVKAIENGLNVAAEYLESDAPSADQKMNMLALTELLCHFTTAICSAVLMSGGPRKDDEPRAAFDAASFFERLKRPNKNGDDPSAR